MNDTRIVESPDRVKCWQDASRQVVLAGAEMVVADLDQTLVATKHVHSSLVRAFMKREAGEALSDSLIECRYSELRGKSYADILRGLKDLCDTSARSPRSLKDFVSAFLEFAKSPVEATQAGKATEIPGASTLLKEVRSLQVPLVVCTGSPRPLAMRFLADAGLNGLIEGGQLFCWGDTPYSKADPDFWHQVLSGIARDRVVALDDHPHSAEYVLGIGQVGRLIINPSVSTEEFEGLRARFPNRVKLIQRSWDDWA